jgi:UDP-glucose 4-epimerase
VELGILEAFMVKRLLDDGYQVTIMDSLERGHKEVVDTRATLHVGNLLDKQFLSGIFEKETFDAVIHFAAYISVAESTEHPDDYFKNNTFGSFSLLEQLRLHKVNKIIFSSTAGVYGNPQQIPIPEDHPKRPESPYGESKLLTENGLAWYQKQYGISFAALRYFNASGAALDGSMGESHTIESHIIPNVIQSALRQVPFHLFGSDYATPDGTCVRDYIHVLDLVEAHILALKKLETEAGGYFYNAGTGVGYSNRQIIETVKRISGKEIALVHEQRRPGDPGTLIADNTKITKELGFKTQYSDLDTIIKTALEWHSKNIK